MMLSLEDVLICEQKVGAGERVAILAGVLGKRGQERLG